MSIDQTETLATVDPKHLERAYVQCAGLFTEGGFDEPVEVAILLDTLEQSHPLLERDEIVDLFRRLCLTVQLVADIDANWCELGYTDCRPNELPSALYQLISSETAFEQSEEGYASTFFARDVLQEAFAMLRPN